MGKAISHMKSLGYTFQKNGWTKSNQSNSQNKNINKTSKGSNKNLKNSTSSDLNLNNGFSQLNENMQRQFDAAVKASELASLTTKLENDRLAKESAERERQQKIESENQRAASMRREAESRIQSDFTRAAENQRILDQQAASRAAQTVAAGSGYNIGTAQQQKISAAGGVSGPAATNTSTMGIPQAILSANTGTGGTQQSSNFSLPNLQGLRFGGM